MIITNQVVNIIDGDTFGKVTESKINTSKLQKLYGMLSGLYKNIYASIIREYVSNAVDSHREINSDEPVLVKLEWKNELNSGNIIVIDKGTGMSPEVMENIYFNYLDSTKEDTNDVHGAFGIGSKSALAYHHTFFINTVVDGIEYKYMFSKQSNGIPAGELLSQSNVDSSNGTTIIIPIKTKDDLYNFFKNAKIQLAYFNNVYLESDAYYYDNNYNVFENDLFFYNTNYQLDTLHITLGNACYQLNYNELNRNPIDIPIAIKFKIGELMPTPSREDIIYSKQSIELINSKIDQTLRWLEDKYNETIFTDLTIKEYQKNKGASDGTLKLSEGDVGLITLNLKTELSKKSASSINLNAPSIKGFCNNKLSMETVSLLRYLGYKLTKRGLNSAGSVVAPIYNVNYNFEIKELRSYRYNTYYLRDSYSTNTYPLYKFSSRYLTYSIKFILLDVEKLDSVKNRYIVDTYGGYNIHFLDKAKYPIGDIKDFIDSLSELYGDRKEAINTIRKLLKLADEYVADTVAKYSEIVVPQSFLDKIEREKLLKKLDRQSKLVKNKNNSVEKLVPFEYIHPHYNTWYSDTVKESEIKKLAHNIIYVEKNNRNYAKELNNLLKRIYKENVFKIITISKRYMKKYENDPTVLSLDEFLNTSNKFATKLAFMFKLKLNLMEFSSSVETLYFLEGKYNNIIDYRVYEERKLLNKIVRPVSHVSMYSSLIDEIITNVDSRNDYSKFNIDIKYYMNILNKHKMYDLRLSKSLKTCAIYSYKNDFFARKLLLSMLELNNIPVNYNVYKKIKQ